MTNKNIKRQKRSLPKQVLISGSACIVIACIFGCASKPKRSEHSLADVLLGRPPAMGVPEDRLEESRLHALSPTVTDESQMMDREEDKRRDQESHELTISAFRARFSEIISEENRADRFPDSARRRELERVASQLLTLRSELTSYGQNPGNLFFYNEGDEKRQIIRKRGEEVTQIDQAWTEHWAGLEERLSDLRSNEALQRLRESDAPRSEARRSSGGQSKVLRN